MKPSTYAAGLIGLALLMALIVYDGAADLGAALRAAGAGLFVVAAYSVVPITCDGLSWRLLLPVAARPGFPTLVYWQWMRQSVSNLLPTAVVGGTALGARQLMQRSIAGPIATASVVAELTFAFLAQCLFTAVGVGLLLHYDHARVAYWSAALVLAVSVMALAGFGIVQHRGLFTVLEALRRRFMRASDLDFGASAAAVDRRLRELYVNPRIWIGCTGWQFAAWTSGTVETWLLLQFFGHPLGWSECLLLESLGQAVRSAALAVPAGIGVQEGGYVLLGGLVGLPPSLGLALSLGKRVRELLSGVPGLVAWQWNEGRRAFRRNP